MKTQNLTKILKLSQQLRSSGYSKYADELEYKFLILKKSENAIYSVFKELGEDLVDAAHPDGSHKLKDVEGDSVFETITDQQKKIKEKIQKEPTGKMSVASAVALIKSASIGKSVLEALFGAVEKGIAAVAKKGGKAATKQIDKQLVKDLAEEYAEKSVREAISAAGRELSKDEMVALERQMIKDSQITVRNIMKQLIETSSGIDKNLANQIIEGIDNALVKTSGEYTGIMSAISTRMKWVLGALAAAITSGEIKNIHDYFKAAKAYTFSKKGTGGLSDVEYIKKYLNQLEELNKPEKLNYEDPVFQSVRAALERIEKINTTEDPNTIRALIEDLEYIKDNLKNEASPSAFMRALSVLVPFMDDTSRAKMYDLLNDKAYKSFIASLEGYIAILRPPQNLTSAQTGASISISQATELFNKMQEAIRTGKINKNDAPSYQKYTIELLKVKSNYDRLNSALQKLQ